MRFIHLEDIVCRGEHHLVTLCQYHRLKYVGNLGYICHLDAVGKSMEDIERQRCHHGITHTVLLIEVSADSPGFLIPPCAPFVDEKTDAAFGVIFVHDVDMATDDRPYLATFA